MGETRMKKPSKRTLKVKQKTERGSSANKEPELMPVESSVISKKTAMIADSSRHSAPTSLSSKTSYTSLVSSASTNSWRKNHDSESYDPSRIEVRLTSDKGYALFATSTIAEGDIVLAEIPAIRLTAKDESEQRAAEAILEEKFSDLPKASQKEFRRLHDTKKDGFSRTRSIYHSNCYNLDGSRSIHGGSCIGLMASRINHSCIPNVQFFFEEVVPDSLLDYNDDACSDGNRGPCAGIMIFRALKRIGRGKEIVSNYETIYATRNQRQFQLQIHYGFRCDCDACAGVKENWETDDNRRLEMMMLRKRVDAVEKRIVILNQGSSGISRKGSYYLKENKASNGAADTADDVMPLTTECCREMLESLEKLDSLLHRAGLLGIERHCIQWEKNVWAKRAGADV